MMEKTVIKMIKDLMKKKYIPPPPNTVFKKYMKKQEREALAKRKAAESKHPNFWKSFDK